MSAAVAPGRHGLGDEPVDDLGGQDADDDGQLVDRDEPAPHLRRRDLGDVHRREVRGQADADAADEAEDDEDGEIRGQGRSDGRDGEEAVRPG